MLGRSAGAVLLGVEARLVDVEVDLGRGLPTIAAVGLAGTAVREGLDRIRAALQHAGFTLPARRITINLAPAEVPKHGASLDLPIAVALLVADGKVAPASVQNALLVGELGLDGSLRSVRGALSMALAARAGGYERMFVPHADAEEAALVDDLDVVPLRNLGDVVAFGSGRRHPRPDVSAERLLTAAPPATDGSDLAEVRGQAAARRALEVAAAGGHHLLLTGPPGSGKTMLARRLAGILPPLDLAEALEVTQVWSAAGLSRGLVTRRPFRAPHHAISFAGLTGGGSRIRPGEISLASHGVLYLDELPEFRRNALEALRQPLEQGTITVVRLHASATLPSAFSLVASMNPCPCGWHGDPHGRCSCGPREVRRYRSKLSGPLLDRFDLVVDVRPVDLSSLAGPRTGDDSETVRRRVIVARQRQRDRAGRNGRMGRAELDAFAQLGPAAGDLLLSACRRFGITARGFDRVRRVARTLADLDGREAIGRAHVAEALQYRHTAPE